MTLEAAKDVYSNALSEVWNVRLTAMDDERGFEESMGFGTSWESTDGRGSKLRTVLV